MNSIFSILFITLCSQIHNRNCRFSIDIWDYNYSLAYTTHYNISRDSIVVTGIGGIQGEQKQVLVRNIIKDAEKKNLCDFLLSFPIDSLNSEYKNVLVEDGDRKKVEIYFNDRKKTIRIENFYQRDIDKLFTVVNQVLEKDIQIHYSK